MKKFITLIFIVLFLLSNKGYSQTAEVTPAAPVTYPKVVGYFSFIVPLVVLNKTETTTDFEYKKNGFAIGFPIGVNVIYGEHIGFSFEFTPTIKATPATATAAATSKMSNLLFDPGLMLRFKHGFTIIPRLAFETSGRYGVTPVFNKIIARTKPCNLFVAGSLPMRVGNATPASIGLNFQFGLILN